MTGLPTVSGYGTLTADPEAKVLPGGKTVVTINVAFNDRRRNKDTGQYETVGTTFLRCSAWDVYGENVAASLSMGDTVFVSGRLVQENWEKDGVKRTAMKLSIDEIGPTLRWTVAKPVRAGRDTVAAGAPGSLVSEGWSGGNAADDPGW